MRIASNKVRDIKIFAQKELKDIYSEEEIRSMITLLIEHFTGLDSIKQSIEPQTTVLESDLLKLNFAIKDLKKEKPIQYIMGKTNFYDLEILLNQQVLIPRPETEELVNLLIKENKSKKDIRIADLGCGSGAISLAIKNNLPQSKVYAFDIEDKAIEQTKENAKRLCLEIEVIKKDILNPSFTKEEFDIIVSNPPYVMEKEKSLMRNNVLCYEPHEALFVRDEDALVFYKAIAEFAKTNLKSKGRIYLEINENLAKETADLFSLFNTEIKKDLFGRYRFIIASKP
ncbi:MAG: peptide chain release factor N(5)-glutamine methyltransferase [Bacteroidales bacterium]|nr:peptide chain release factor N(5)-glutamine methyltransferase [Bacteroidales bacterium]MDD4684067.1 peptide chain release factor N(5)-glutamine methyltransferase [Bacteroidales bacterium]